MTTILVIEDEQAIRQNLLDLLEAEGFEAAGAENGRVGLERIFAKLPDLVVCDVTMPELDGHAVLRAVRGEPSTRALPFVFLTAKAERADLRAGMNLGADDYLTKPFSRTELLDAIRMRLRRAAEAREREGDESSSLLRAAPRAPGRAEFEPGTMFGRYRVDGALGAGGMGQVYRAFDTRLQRTVALKLLRHDLVGTAAQMETATARLLSEARAAAALRHRSVVTIFDVGKLDGLAYLAMEFIAGRQIHRACRGARWQVVVGLLAQVTEGLAAAHDVGLVHRDVKPENVMVRDDGTVVVLDFGIARRLDPGRSGLNQEMIGTVGYMAPEQIDGGSIDGRADQFGWGVMAYELLAHRSPWGPSRNVVATLTAVTATEPPDLGELVPELPRPLVAAVMRALSKRREARFGSMNELRQALAPYGEAPPPRASTGDADAPEESFDTVPVEGPPEAAVALADTVPRTPLPSPAPSSRPSTDPAAQRSAAATTDPSALVRRGRASRATALVLVLLGLIAAAAWLLLLRHR